MIFLLAALAAPAMVETAQEPDAAAMLESAREARDQKKWPEALNLYSRVLDRQPGNGEALLERAKLASWMKKYPESIRDYKRYIQLFPEKKVEGEKDLANVLAWSKQYKAGIAMLEPYVRQGERQAILAQANFKSWDGQYSNCLKQVNAYLQQNPDDQDFLLLRAKVRSWSGDHGGAREDYNKLLAKNGQSKEALMGMASLESWQGNPEGAEEHMAKLSSEDKRSGDAVIALSRIDQQRGRLLKARRDLEPLREDASVGGEIHRRFWELSAAQGPYLEVSRSRMDSNEDIRQDKNNVEVGLPFFNGLLKGGWNGYLLKENAYLGMPYDSEIKPKQYYAGIQHPLASRLNLGGTVYWLEHHGPDYEINLDARAGKGWNVGLGYSRMTNMATPKALFNETKIKNWTLYSSYFFGENLNQIDLSLEYGKVTSENKTTESEVPSGTPLEDTRKAYSASYTRRIVFPRVELRLGAIVRGTRNDSENRLPGYWDPEKYMFYGAKVGCALAKWNVYSLAVDGQVGNQKTDDNGSELAWGYNASLSATPFGPGMVLFGSFGQSSAASQVFNIGNPDGYKESNFRFGLRLISPKWLW